MSIEPITIPMSIEVNDVTIDSTIETNEVTIESTFDAKIEVVEGGDITVQSLTVTENGTTTAPTGKAYSPVIVNVPNSYTNADEGKVVQNGALTSQTSTTKSANGTYDTTTNNQVTVSVPASAVDTGTKSISTNGTHDVVGYASAAVNVPNTYTASDEGKVVDNGVLVAQTSTTVTTNGTYDTTTNDEVVVNVSGGTPTLITKTITENGTYSAEDDDADGYSEVTVNVSGGGGQWTTDGFIAGTEPSGVLTVSSTIRDHLFYKNSAITELYGNGDNITLESASFSICSALTKVHGHFILAGSVFDNCANLLTVVIDKVVNGTNCISRNPKLMSVDIIQTVAISNNNAFYGDTVLKTLVLRSDSVVTLGNTGSFNKTPFASNGTGGTLYVPQALIADYQAASNWSTILGYPNNQILSIEGSIYETQYADGTPIE